MKFWIIITVGLVFGLAQASRAETVECTQMSGASIADSKKVDDTSSDDSNPAPKSGQMKSGSMSRPHNGPMGGGAGGPPPGGGGGFPGSAFPGGGPS